MSPPNDSKVYMLRISLFSFFFFFFLAVVTAGNGHCRLLIAWFQRGEIFSFHLLSLSLNYYLEC